MVQLYHKTKVGQYHTLKRERFKTFYKHLPYLDMEELITHFCVFDGYPDLGMLNNHEKLLENIENSILKEYQTLKKMFIFSDDKRLQEDIQTTLHRLAIGTRKHYSIYKDLSKERGREAYIYLFENQIINREISRERPIIRLAHQPLKKELRGYKIEDKIRFEKEFYRFWFTFIYPNQDDLEKSEYNQTLKDIKENIDYFVSGFFEEISNSLIEDIYKNKILESGSYWDRDVEIDLFVKLKNGENILGECKWKNHKVSKNILNKLKKVSIKAGLRADYFALFSKNGFSKELQNLEENNLLLYDLESFKRLIL
jgi:hypothetical protein